MKKFIFIFFIPYIMLGQVDVPAEHWINDSNFEKKINEKDAVGDDNLNSFVV